MERVNKSVLLASALALMAVIFWSGNWVLGRSVRATVPPLGLNFWRWSVAMLVLAPFALPGVIRYWSAIRAGWWPLFGLGLTGAAMFQSMVYLGVKSTEAINALLLNATAPLYVIIIARVVLAERVSARQAFGIAVSFVGAGYIVLRGDLTTVSQMQFNRGDMWILAALVVWGAYSVLLRFRPAGVPALPLVFMISVIGAAIMLPGYLWEMGQGRFVVFDRTTLLAIGYVGLFASVVAFLAYNAAVARLGPTRAVTFLHFMPVSGAALSIIFLGERLESYHLVGFPVVLTGVLLATQKSG